MAVYYSNEDAWKAQTAAEYAAGLAIGAASVTNQFRSFGKRLYQGETPAVFDPGVLASGAFSVDAAGSVTVPLKTGIAAGLPSTGYCLVLPATSSLGRALIAGDLAWAVLRTTLEAQAGTTGTFRFGMGLLNTADPTTAQGWGIGVQASGASYVSLYLAAPTAGAWTASTGGTSQAIDRPTEGTLVQRTGNSQARQTSRIDSTTGQPSSASAGIGIQAAPSPIYFTGGTWVFVYWGTNDALITAGNYTGRAATSINDSLFTDTVGV